MAILAIGAALIDILVDVNDENILVSLGHPRGSMIYVDRTKQQTLLKQIEALNPIMACGGSAANAINGAAGLGDKAVFIGQVGDDQMGELFKNNMLQNGVTPHLLLTDQDSTGTVVAMITPDKERTMATCLGAASSLQAEMLTDDMFYGQKILFVEGYLIYNGHLIERVMSMAKQHGLLVAFDMASYNVVEENRDYMKYLVEKYVDILFANEQEAKSYTGQIGEVAAGALASCCDIAIVKLGAKGSVVCRKGEVVKVGVIEQAVARDKTGAGDLYAGGFLWALAEGMTLKQCAEIGAVLSSRVIEVVGTAMSKETWKDINDRVQRIKECRNGLE